MTAPSPLQVSAWKALLKTIIDDDLPALTLLLKKNPELVNATATNEEFCKPLVHQIYFGATALHLAAGGYRVEMVRLLLKQGAKVRAANRRGAQPLHAAAVGGPDTQAWNPERQTQTIKVLHKAGANLNALNKEGVAALHRAVRARCSAAVNTLLSLGASTRLKNGKSGSTPLHLAVQTTGRGGSGSPMCRIEQRKIIQFLLKSGAQATDKNGQGKTVADSTKDPEWLALLQRAN